MLSRLQVLSRYYGASVMEIQFGYHWHLPKHNKPQQNVNIIYGPWG